MVGMAHQPLRGICFTTNWYPLSLSSYSGALVSELYGRFFLTLSALQYLLVQYLVMVAVSETGDWINVSNTHSQCGRRTCSGMQWLQTCRGLDYINVANATTSSCHLKAIDYTIKYIIKRKLFKTSGTGRMWQVHLLAESINETITHCFFPFSTKTDIMWNGTEIALGSLCPRELLGSPLLADVVGTRLMKAGLRRCVHHIRRENRHG